MVIKSRVFAMFLLIILTVVSNFSVYANTSSSAQQLTDAQIAEKLGVLEGEGKGVTQEYLAKTPTRIQAALMYLRLKGLDAEAEAYQGKDNFADAYKAEWARNIMAYLKAYPDLGMVGVGNNLFSPDTTMTAQGYYKVMLEALGYKQDVDFKWNEVFTFAASKGLSKVAGASRFTVDNLATATVEAMKAKTKNSNDTLASILVKTGKISQDQFKLLNLPLTSTPATANFELTIKSSKEVSVKFDKPVEDTSKITFVVSRMNSNSAETVAAIWNSAKTEVVLTKASKFTIGEYTVTVLHDKTVLGSKTIIFEAEKIASIDFSPETIIRISDTKGEATYVVKNQYGEDVSTSSLAQTIKWTVSEGSVSVDQSSARLTITKEGTAGVSQLKDVKSINVTGVDLNTKVTVVKPLDITTGEGLIKDFKFTGLYNKNGKTEITVDSTDRFYINYEALDEAGNKIDSYNILSNVGALALSQSNQNITARVVRDPYNTNKALIEVGSKGVAGECYVTGIAVATGKSDTFKVEIKPGAELSEFTIEAPSSPVNANEKVELRYRAVDSKGDAISKYESIQGKVTFISNDAPNTIISAEKKADGTFALYATFRTVKQYTITSSVTSSGKTTSATIAVNSATVPTSITVVDRNIIYPTIVENGHIVADFMKNPAFKVVDQNNNEINLGEKFYIDSYYYYINVVSADPGKVRVLGDMFKMAYKDSQITLVGGNTRGTTSVIFELCKDVDTNPGNGKTVIDSKEISITNVDRTSIVRYEIMPIPELYANPDVTHVESLRTISPLKQEYAEDVKIYGIANNGDKVALKPMVGDGNEILNLSVTDTGKFYVDNISKRVIAKSLKSGIQSIDKLTATLLGPMGQILTVSTELKATDETPVCQSVDVVLKKDSPFTKVGDSFMCQAGIFNLAVVGKELKPFDTAENITHSADIMFVLKDQYGKTALLPSYFSVRKVKGTGTLYVDAKTGLVSGSVNPEDVYEITAVASNGLLKTVTVVIQ